MRADPLWKLVQSSADAKALFVMLRKESKQVRIRVVVTNFLVFILLQPKASRVAVI